MPDPLNRPPHREVLDSGASPAPADGRSASSGGVHVAEHPKCRRRHLRVSIGGRIVNKYDAAAMARSQRRRSFGAKAPRREPAETRSGPRAEARSGRDRFLKQQIEDQIGAETRDQRATARVDRASIWTKPDACEDDHEPCRLPIAPRREISWYLQRRTSSDTVWVVASIVTPVRSSAP